MGIFPGTDDCRVQVDGGVGPVTLRFQENILVFVLVRRS